MPRFNYTKAREDGLTDQEIFAHLEDAKKNGVKLTLDKNEVEAYRIGVPFAAETPMDRNKIMSWASKAFESTGKSVGGLIMGAVEGIQEAVSGKTIEQMGRKRQGFDVLGRGEKPAPTPRDIAFTALELAPSVGPLARAVTKPLAMIPGVAPAAKAVATATKGVGTKVLSTMGEVFTGVKTASLRKWYQAAKNAPDKLERAKDAVTRNPQQPFLAFADTIAERIGGLKNSARETFTAAVDEVRARGAGISYNLESKLPELNSTLEKFRLKVKQVREAGRITDEIVVAPTTRTSPFTQRPRELQQLTEIVRKMRVKDMTVDELLDFDESVKQFFEMAVRQEDSKLIALATQLTRDASKFVDDVLPEVNDANRLYRDYYEVMEKLGGKIVDASGVVRGGAESFLGNVMNLNKGAQRRAMEEASAKLGTNVLEDASLVKVAQQLMEMVPNTTRNRTMDIVKVALGGALVTNPEQGKTLIPLLVLSVFSSPKLYGNLLEGIAGTQRRLSTSRVVQSLTEEEISLIKTIFARPGVMAAESITGE